VYRAQIFARGRPVALDVPTRAAVRGMHYQVVVVADDPPLVARDEAQAGQLDDLGRGLRVREGRAPPDPRRAAVGGTAHLAVPADGVTAKGVQKLDLEQSIRHVARLRFPAPAAVDGVQYDAAGPARPPLRGAYEVHAREVAVGRPGRPPPRRAAVRRAQDRAVRADPVKAKAAAPIPALRRKPRLVQSCSNISVVSCSVLHYARTPAPSFPRKRESRSDSLICESTGPVITKKTFMFFSILQLHGKVGNFVCNSLILWTNGFKGHVDEGGLEGFGWTKGVKHYLKRLKKEGRG